MKSLRRLAKPLLYSSILGIGGYYLYDSYRFKGLENLETKQQNDTQIFPQNIPALIQYQGKQHHTAHEVEDLDLQKEESFEKHKHQQTAQQTLQKSKQPTQSTTQQKLSQSPEQKSEQKTTQSTQQKSQQIPTQHVKQRSEQIPVKNATEKLEQKPQQLIEQKSEQKSSPPSQQKAEQTPAQLSHQKSEEKSPETNPTDNVELKLEQSAQQQTHKETPSQQQKEQVKTKHPEPKVKLDLSKLQRLSEIPQLPKKSPEQLKAVLVVADMGYTQQFQEKLLDTIRNLKNIPNSQNIEIFRVNIADEQAQQRISKAYGHKVKEETIFLIKNELDDNFVDINFDMYMQYPTLINTYMTKLNLFNTAKQQEYLKRLEKMSPNEAYLMFVYDDTQPKDKRTKSLLAAKYVEMELALHHLDHAIKVIPVEATLAKNSNVIPAQKIRAKSLHIIRKHNEFTHAHPNLHLKFNDEITPFHLLADVGFHNKRGQVAIQSYLSKVQTFNSLSITTPYILSVTIDKNRITTENYKLLMETFKQIKRKNPFPEVGIALKFGQVGYLGKNQPENPEFCIKMANVAELQNQSSMHEIQNLENAKTMGITEKNWLMNSYEFLYPHQAVSEGLIQDFVGKVLSEQVPQYYRSDKPSSIQNVPRVVGSNFNKEILEDKLDHFVFEYSDHCPSCKLISPLIGYINDILQPIPVEQRFDIHVMNCQKNRVKGQVYSPYTPTMNYFKNEWKHSGPVKIGLETIKNQGLVGLYDFCVITKLLKSIDTKKFNQSIENSKNWNKSEFVL